jgi:hypothetical protein
VESDPDSILQPDPGGIQFTEGTRDSHRLRSRGHSRCMFGGPVPVAPFYQPRQWRW